MSGISNIYIVYDPYMVRNQATGGWISFAAISTLGDLPGPEFNDKQAWRQWLIAAFTKKINISKQLFLEEFLSPIDYICELYEALSTTKTIWGISKPYDEHYCLSLKINEKDLVYLKLKLKEFKYWNTTTDDDFNPIIVQIGKGLGVTE